MFGLKVRDSNPHYDGVLIGLRDVLVAIGEKVLISRWICRDLDYITKENGEFYETREDRRRLSGVEMMRFADTVHHILDGRFEARTEGPSKMLWLAIVVFDSSCIEVWTLKKELLAKLKAHFKKVSDMELSYDRK